MMCIKTKMVYIKKKLLCIKKRDVVYYIKGGCVCNNRFCILTKQVVA